MMDFCSTLGCTAIAIGIGMLDDYPLTIFHEFKNNHLKSIKILFKEKTTNKKKEYKGMCITILSVENSATIENLWYIEKNCPRQFQ